MKSPLLLIGAGRMGGALLKGWLKGGLGPVVAVEPNPAPALKRLKGVTFVPAVADLPRGRYRATVVALKPQVLKPLAESLAPVIARSALALSIAAGVNTKFLQKAWGKNARIVRAMPNTPGSIGRGISGLFAGKGCEPKDLKLAEALLSALGATLWVGREGLIDAVTAISGSGPAYVFALAETLAAAGVELGLTAPEAERLARATVAGSGALMDADLRPAADLRRDVTSPGGTTEAALEILLGADGFPKLMKRAATAAAKRAAELGK
jgi:pyrroline-5-carboxylate reductase